MATTYEKEQKLLQQVAPRIESELAGVEVLALELTTPSRFCVYVDRPDGGVDHALCKQVTDALLAAYKKTPGASRHAAVEMDDLGDFRVFSIELPADVEERLLEDARERKLDELERLEEETGERQHTLITDDDLDVDWAETVSYTHLRAHETGRNLVCR